MDLQFTAAQIQMPAPGQEAAQSSSSPAKSSNAGRGHKPFSSVLRSLRQDDAPQPRSTSKDCAPGSDQSRTTAASDTRADETRSKEGPARDPSDVPSQSSGESTQQAQGDQSAMSDERSVNTHGESSVPAATDATSQALALALVQSQPTTVLDTPDSALVSFAGSGETGHATEHPEAAIAVTSLMAAGLIGQPATAGTASPSPVPMDGNESPSTGSTETSPDETPTTAAIHALPVTGRPDRDADRPATVFVPPQTDTGREVAHKKDQPLEAPLVDARPAEAPAQEQKAPSPQPEFIRIIDSSGMHHLRQHEPLASPSDQPAPEVSEHEGTSHKQEAALPHGWQTFTESDQASDMPPSDKETGGHDRSEQPPARETAARVPSVAEPQGPASSTFTVAPGNHSMPRTLESQPAPAVPAAVAAREISDMPAAGSSRSVVFEVAQPDLGRVHVRVAMSNEVVHAHFSSDRPDVGHFLMNGQDRLQAALQASGLEMGHFRVDIDRQSAGRSFQQGPSQEQDRTGQQHSGHSQTSQRQSDPHDGARTRARGIVNLVA